MLATLNIKNIALIDELSIDFAPGMNCLTGETGAGKSIIIDSINCVLGGRTSRETIRTGTDKASVEAVFYIDRQLIDDKLEEVGIEAEEDTTLILFREIHTSGKNICRINGKLVTLSVLKEVGEYLIDIHGQHDNQSLMRVSSHIFLLDMYAGDKLNLVLDEYKRELHNFKEINRLIEGLAGDPKERERTIDLLKYQIDEIVEAKLKVGEDLDLVKEIKILSNMERIIQSLNDAYINIMEDDFAYDLIEKSRLSLSRILDLNGDYEKLYLKIEEIKYSLEDIGESLRKQVDSDLFDKEQMAYLEDRLDKINSLKRKYGESIEDILSFKEKAEKDLDYLVDSEDKLKELLDNLDICGKKLIGLANDLNVIRREASKELSKNIVLELGDLEMMNASFEVLIERVEEEEKGYPKFKKQGLDNLEFLVSANVGEIAKPLAKIASGGELSRIMLAIKSILADVDKIPIMIFDEIDMGISGQAANKVGQKMKKLSKDHQVICVSHLAQIAAMADHNILISKYTEGNKTKTQAKGLNYEEKVHEVGRLLDGDSKSEITRAHAKKMIEENKC